MNRLVCLIFIDYNILVFKIYRKLSMFYNYGGKSII
jgi:hypothetical protein